MKINLFPKILLLNFMLISAGQLLYIPQAWSDTRVTFRILVQDAEHPDIFNPYEGAELELEFSPTEETPKYGSSNSESIYAEFIKKYPPVKVHGISNAQGKVEFTLAPGVYRLIGLKITNEPKDLLKLVLDWNPEPFKVTKGEIAKLPDLKFVQPIEVFFPKDGEAVPIDGETVEFAWKPYHKADYYKLEVMRFFDSSARGGFHIQVYDTKIDWTNLKEEIIIFNQRCKLSPELQVILEPGYEYRLGVRAFDFNDKELSGSWSKFKIIK